METDVDAYFAKHDIPSVISDMLFELGFHRPKDVGKFMAAYVERRFHLADAMGGATGGDKRGAHVDGMMYDGDFSTIEVHTHMAAAVRQGSEDAEACAMLEEARSLSKKYREFRAQPVNAEGAAVPKTPGEVDLSSITIIPFKEFRMDYERLLLIFTNPQVWTFCERRLGILRGLFDAHCAINAAAEESESAKIGPEERVDTCVQLASSLAPHRLMCLLNRKARKDAAVEVAAGKTLRDLTAALNRPVLPGDLVQDPDLPQSSTAELAGIFSRTSNLVRGQYLAEAVKEGFGLLEATNDNTGGTAYADYRLPLTPESGAWVDLARWVSEFEVESKRARWVIQLSQAAYSGLKDRRSVLNYGELLDNAFGPPAAASNINLNTSDLSTEDERMNEQLAAMLSSVSGFELASIPGISEDHLPADLEREPNDWNTAANPPYSYQLYHMWSRLKGLNFLREEAQLPPLDLRCATSNAEPLACAYLLGVSGTTRCASLASHFPMQYLFALELDELTVSVSLSSKRSLNSGSSVPYAEAGSKVLWNLFRAGVAATLCTEDTTLSQQVDNALAAEYCLARNALGLREADLAEFARNSMAASGFLHRSDKTAAEAEAGKERPKTIRQRYRSGRRDAELKLISTMAQQVTAGRSAATKDNSKFASNASQMSATSQKS